MWDLRGFCHTNSKNPGEKMMMKLILSKCSLFFYCACNLLAIFWQSIYTKIDCDSFKFSFICSTHAWDVFLSKIYILVNPCCFLFIILSQTSISVSILEIIKKVIKSHLLFFFVLWILFFGQKAADEWQMCFWISCRTFIFSISFYFPRI